MAAQSASRHTAPRMGGGLICAAFMRGECQSRLSVRHYINADAHCGVCNTGITLSSISIILPAKNEAESLKTLLPRLVSAQPDAQIIVVDAGSPDDTRAICLPAGVQCLSSQIGGASCRGRVWQSE